jgi:hypothetical protein
MRGEDSSLTLWSALMVGLIYTICSLVAMYLLNRFLLTLMSPHSRVANLTSDSESSPTSWPIARTTMCR